MDSSTTAKSTNQQESVNQIGEAANGLTLWKQTREQWVGNGRIQAWSHILEPCISWNATYESLLGTNKPFRKPIPLFEMVDFLVDIWEEEGLYDS